MPFEAMTSDTVTGTQAMAYISDHPIVIGKSHPRSLRCYLILNSRVLTQKNVLLYVPGTYHTSLIIWIWNGIGPKRLPILSVVLDDRWLRRMNPPVAIAVDRTGRVKQCSAPQ